MGSTSEAPASSQHRIAILDGFRDLPTSEWEEFEKKWSDKGVTFIQQLTQCKGPSALGKDDVFKNLRQLEADHGPIDGIASMGALLHRYTPVGEEFCNCFPHLAFLTSGGAGYDNIDTKVMSEHGVYYCNTPEAVAVPTADAASTMILMALRNFISYDRNVRKGKWKEGTSLGTNPRDATIGILGMGSIGGIVAGHMQAFGAKVVYHNRNKLPQDSEHGATYIASLEDFLGECDIVSVHVPLSSATRHILSSKEFSQFKKGGKLVNTARGPVVDEEALVEALRSGHLAGAALDVFEHEPTVHPWLLQADNVLLLPHHGSSTTGTGADVVRNQLKNLDSYLSLPAGQPPHNAVNKITPRRLNVRLRLQEPSQPSM